MALRGATATCPRKFTTDGLKVTGQWNVSNVEDMLSMFQNCEDFNQPLNNWNVSNVEDMENMFQNARSFNQPLHAPWYHEDSESE